MTIGSIEGKGSYMLGTKKLTIIGYTPPAAAALAMTARRAPLAAATEPQVFEVSGSIEGEGGSLEKTGPDTLILSGANTYTGSTKVLDGILRFTGSFAGPVEVQAGVLNVIDNGLFDGGLVIGPGGTVVLGLGIPAVPGALLLAPDSVFELEIDRPAHRRSPHGEWRYSRQQRSVPRPRTRPRVAGDGFTVPRHR